MYKTRAENRIAYLKYAQEKIDEEFSSKVVPYTSSLIDKVLNIQDPLLIYIEKEEYTYLNFIIEEKLSYLEREIIYRMFGFYGKLYPRKEIEKELGVDRKIISLVLKRSLNKIKYYYTLEFGKIKKGSKRT